ncbi:MAG: hypothetical protein P1U85_06480 [Verrucomicrobiales bacterium]|nr:hypothetical protein [Verrucomicrobiales bacterium]
MKNYLAYTGAFLCLVLGAWNSAHSQDKGIEEFEKKVEERMAKRIVEEAKAEADGRPLTPGILIVCEFIEVEMKDFSDWVLENPIKTDASPLRKAVQSWIQSEGAALVETLVVSAKSGQRAKVEAVEEFIYSTEYDPPNTASVKPEGESVELIPPNGTAFETRNVGATLEVDPVLGEDGTIDLNLAPEIVIADDPVDWVTKLGDVEMTVPLPRFHTTKATTQISVHPGDYALIGTSRLGISKMPEAKDPIILIFVRCDVSG